MKNLGHNSEMTTPPARGIVLPEAISGLPLKGDFQRMARRRFQHPKPFREGSWWWMLVWEDVFSGGKLSRRKKRVKLAPADMSAREVGKVADEYLRPINQGLQAIGSATNFTTYVNETYIPVVLPLMATSTRERYLGIIKNYLLPEFGELCLRDLDTLQLQRYFSAMAGTKLSHESRDKIKDVLSSILGTAVRYQLLVKNPIEGVQLPPKRRGKRIAKPNITSEPFDALVNLMQEPCATMVYVCVMAGLRVSELVGLKWEDIHADSLTVDERFSRGEWGCPKTSASSATIGVDERVVERINRLKDMEVTINWGARGAKKTFKLVRSATPGDLVFQSLIKQGPMSDHNVLSRHIKPAARKLGIGWVNWQVLRRSYATWLVEAGADPKAVQAQMRHSRSSTTMDIYAQFVPAAQRRAVSQMMDMVTARLAKATSPSEMVN
jgi:integrase